MITVKFFKLNYPQSRYDRSGHPAEITVDTNDYDKAHSRREYRTLARWVNNRAIFARCKKYEDYNTI